LTLTNPNLLRIAIDYGMKESAYGGGDPPTVLVEAISVLDQSRNSPKRAKQLKKLQ